jgi:hypothetical protein
MKKLSKRAHKEDNTHNRDDETYLSLQGEWNFVELSNVEWGLINLYYF